MARYVLMPRAQGISIELRRRILHDPEVEIIDETLGKALLVEATEIAVTRLRASLDGWIVTPEVEYSLPTPPRERVPRPGAAVKDAAQDLGSDTNAIDREEDRPEDEAPGSSFIP